MMKSFTFSSKEFSIRPVRMSDAKALNAIINEPDVNKFVLVERPASMDSTRKSIRAKLKENRWLVVVSKGNVIGSIELRPYAKRKSHVTDFGISFSSRVHGSGIAFAAMRAVFRYLKAQGFRVIQSNTFADNPRARRFYSKLGFKELCRLPKTVKRGNRFIDELVIFKVL